MFICVEYRPSMSENDPSTEAKKKTETSLPDLSALNFVPDWARDKPKRESRSRSNDERREGGRERKRSQKGGSDQAGGRQRRRNDAYQGGGRDNRNRGRHNNRSGRNGPVRKTYTPPPEGITARIMPIEEGLDALAKDIAATGRTHSVFDIAWLVLGELSRFHVIFESETQMLYRSKKDHSLWLSQRECMAHFWDKNIVKDYYKEEVVEVEPPKGNFQSVARCGISGVLIGPPNHHAYQKTILELHRSRFSHIPIERYKSKIVMEHSEEAVAEWVESMKKHIRWIPLDKKAQKAKDDSKKSSEPTTDDVSSEGAESVAENAKESENAIEPTVSSETKETVQDQEGEVLATSSEKEKEMAEENAEVSESLETPSLILDSRQEVEQHFLSHGFKKEFAVGKTMSVLANVPAKMIDPGLLTLLKNTVKEERRYPGKLASILCRQLSGRHLAVFKWKKHLHCGPARPKQVSDSMVMADRPGKMFHWVNENPGGTIDSMWKALLAEDVDDDTRHQWYHDLHWLINEGFVLLFSDGKLHAAKEFLKKKEAGDKKESSDKSSSGEKKSSSANQTENEKASVKEGDEKKIEEKKSSTKKESSEKKDDSNRDEKDASGLQEELEKVPSVEQLIDQATHKSESEGEEKEGEIEHSKKENPSS